MRSGVGAHGGAIEEVNVDGCENVYVCCNMKVGRLCTSALLGIIVGLILARVR